LPVPVTQNVLLALNLDWNHDHSGTTTLESEIRAGLINWKPNIGRYRYGRYGTGMYGTYVTNKNGVNLTLGSRGSLEIISPNPVRSPSDLQKQTTLVPIVPVFDGNFV